MMMRYVVHGWRKYCGLTIRDAAERIGIDKSAFLRLENGKPLNEKNLAAVMTWLLKE